MLSSHRMITPRRPTDLSALRVLVDLLRRRRVVVLTGAGCSTESGIPDYRGPEGSLKDRRPMRYGEFVRRPENRARYWARSLVGWPRMSGARPNAGHRALAELEAADLVAGVITQNVDGLHTAAGSRRVVELHGTLARVRCLDCGARASRAGFQDRLLALNPEWATSVLFDPVGVDGESEPVESAPDGDAELPAGAAAGFRIPPCEACGGVVKPDVVFFGESVPEGWVERAWRLLDEAEVLLIAGSSLTVYSGRRFLYGARDRGLPVGIVNLGPTRGDEAATARVDGRVGWVLPRLARALLA